MNDIAGLANIGTDMVKKGNFVWLITMRFHPLWFVYNNQVYLDKLPALSLGCPKGSSFGDNLPRQKSTGKHLQDLRDFVPVDFN